MSHIDNNITYEVLFFGIYTYNYLNSEYTRSKFESNNDEDVTWDREATRLGMTKDVWEITPILSVTETRIRDVTLQS
jgi:hypothetical protein